MYLPGRLGAARPEIKRFVMNGTNGIYTRMTLPRDGAISRQQGARQLWEGPARDAPEEARKQSGGNNMNIYDDVLISSQAKERYQAHGVLKLETPPHITTVKEHIQKLAEQSLLPVHESSAESGGRLEKSPESVFLEESDVLPGQKDVTETAAGENQVVQTEPALQANPAEDGASLVRAPHRNMVV